METMYPYNRKRSLSSSTSDGENWLEQNFGKYSRVDHGANQQSNGTQSEAEFLKQRINDLESSEKAKDRKIENQRKHLNAFHRSSQCIFQTEADNLKKAVSAKDAKIKSLHRENSRLDTSLMEKDDKIIDLESDIEEANDTIANKDDKIFDLEHEVEEANAIITSKDEEIEDLQIDADRRQKADFKNLQDQVKYLRGQLMTAQGLICEKEVENQQLKNDKGDLEAEVEQANEQAAVIQDRLNVLFKQINTHTINDEKNEDIIEIKDNLNRNDEEHENHEEMMTEKERAHLETLNDKVNDLQSQLIKSAELISVNEATLEQLREAKEATDTDLQVAETRASALEEKVKELRKHLQEGNSTAQGCDNLLKALAASKKDLAVKYAKIQKMVVKLDALAEDVNDEDVKLKVQDIYADALMI